MELTTPKAENFSTKSQSDWLRSLVVASLVALATAAAAHADVSPAAFEQFPAQSVYTGKRVRPNVATRWARQYRTHITEAGKQKPNFAGHFVITEWGCGTGCTHGAAVNLKTGEVIELPESVLNAAASEKADGREFKPNSRLLVVNSSENPLSDGVAIHTRCYEVRKGRANNSLVELSCPKAVDAVTDGREGFCAGEPNYNACVSADQGAKRSHHSPEAYTACAELADYVNAEEGRRWERCLAKQDRAIKGRAQR